MVFQDRREAGKVLGGDVAALPELEGGVVLGLPRGGVPVAYEVAHACGLPLDVLLVRKLGVPGQEELAMGAIASGGIVVLNRRILHSVRISKETLCAAVERAKQEMERQEREFRGGRAAIEIQGRTVILVDDGLATGATMRAAARAVRPVALRVIVAVPVGAEITCRDLAGEADQIICHEMPDPFEAVGNFYLNFEPTSDEEVRELMSAGSGD
jgi:putative phosphoribosyl transferase